MVEATEDQLKSARSATNDNSNLPPTPTTSISRQHYEDLKAKFPHARRNDSPPASTSNSPRHAPASPTVPVSKSTGLSRDHHQALEAKFRANSAPTTYAAPPVGLHKAGLHKAGLHKAGLHKAGLRKARGFPPSEDLPSPLSDQSRRNRNVAATAVGAFQVRNDEGSHNDRLEIIIDEGDNNDEEQPETPTTATASPTQDQLLANDDLEQNASNDDFLVEATLVPTDSNPNVLEAQPVGDLDFLKNPKVLSCVALCSVGIILLVVLLVMGLLFWRYDSDSIASAARPKLPPPPPMLERITKADVLKCGVSMELRQFASFSGQKRDPVDDFLDGRLCRALAAAILGDSDKVEVVLVSVKSSEFGLLVNNTIDVLLFNIQTNADVDVYQTQWETGFSLSLPWAYTELVFGGAPQFVACAQDNFNTFDECQGILFCINDEATSSTILVDNVPEGNLFYSKDMAGSVASYLKGDCNVVLSMRIFMEWLLVSLGVPNTVLGNIPIAKALVTMASNEYDTQFTDFLNSVLLALFTAEQRNVTQSNAAAFGQTDLFGDAYADMFVNAIAASGNFAEIYDKGWSRWSGAPEWGPWNGLNNGTTPLMYTLNTFDTVGAYGPGPAVGGTLESILNGGKLRCGVHFNRPGFALNNSGEGLYQGLDVDFCRGLAASIFRGAPGNLELVEVLEEEEGYGKLASGDVDVLAGFTWTIQNDVNETSTGKGYSFSQPYFYSPMESKGNISFAENLCLVTRQDDAQFSSFTNIVVGCIIDAEERSISQRVANRMTDVRIFGDDFLKMFRDVILVVGNYGEIYERNLGAILHRSQRNLVNKLDSAGPQRYIPPWI